MAEPSSSKDDGEDQADDEGGDKVDEDSKFTGIPSSSKSKRTRYSNTST